MLKSIIVDDHSTSLSTLKNLLEEFCPEVDVVSLCQNVSEGLAAIHELKPEVVFLDVHLGDETGFDLLTQAGDINFKVIFTTAHSEYAVKAFKFSAVDYLLKPINIEELKAAVNKVEKQSDASPQRLQYLVQNLKSSSHSEFKLALPTSEGLYFVKLSEILYCEASSNYTKFVMDNGKKHLISRTLKEYDDILSEYNFYRIHHSYLINLDAVKRYVRGIGGYVIMTNDKHLDVSKRKKDGFLARMGIKE